MAIDLIKEILNHSDDEVIAYLAAELAEIKRVYVKATKEKSPELLYMAAPNLNEVYAIVNALNRRNEERRLKQSY